MCFWAMATKANVTLHSPLVTFDRVGVTTMFRICRNTVKDEINTGRSMDCACVAVAETFPAEGIFLQLHEIMP